MRSDNAKLLDSFATREVRVASECSGLGPEHFAFKNLSLNHRVRYVFASEQFPSLWM